jgi:hypothetical protein
MPKMENPPTLLPPADSFVKVTRIFHMPRVINAKPSTMSPCGEGAAKIQMPSTNLL